MTEQLPPSAKSLDLTLFKKTGFMSFTHKIFVGSKRLKQPDKKNSQWHLKNIPNNLSKKQAIPLAELEVFAQEYRRLLCPTHLFNGKNIYTKYRLGYDEQHPDNLYVASKSLKLMGRSGDFSFDHEGTLTFKDDPTTGLNLKDIPGLGCSCLFAKILGEVDFKIQNAVIINDGLKADGTPQLYFSQIDSEWSFAGTANTKFRSLNLDTGLMTAREVIANPYTLSKFYNYLSLIQKGTDHYQFKGFLLKTSQEPHVKQETMITALRSALLPDFFEEPLMSHYFSKSKSSQKTKKTIQSYMKEQKNILVEVLTQESECREFFLNDDAIQSGLLRKELNEMFNSLKEFTAYSKVKPSDAITDFEEKFILNLQEFITLMIMNPTMNKDQRKAFFNEAKQASAQSDFNRLFFKTVCLSIESSIYEQIKSLSLNFEHRREMIQSSGSWSDYNDLKTEIKSSIAMIDDILDKLESLPPSGLEEYNREVRRLRDDLIEKNKLLQVSATTYQKMYRYLVPKSEKKLLFSGHGELFAEGIYHAHNIQPRR